jgi:hypothetical protein
MDVSRFVAIVSDDTAIVQPRAARETTASRVETTDHDAGKTADVRQRRSTGFDKVVERG